MECDLLSFFELRWRRTVAPSPDSTLDYVYMSSCTRKQKKCSNQAYLGKRWEAVGKWAAVEVLKKFSYLLHSEFLLRPSRRISMPGFSEKQRDVKSLGVSKCATIKVKFYINYITVCVISNLTELTVAYGRAMPQNTFDSFISRKSLHKPSEVTLF